MEQDRAWELRSRILDSDADEGAGRFSFVNVIPGREEGSYGVEYAEVFNDRTERVFTLGDERLLGLTG